MDAHDIDWVNRKLQELWDKIHDLEAQLKMKGT